MHIALPGLLGADNWLGSSKFQVPGKKTSKCKPLA